MRTTLLSLAFVSVIVSPANATEIYRYLIEGSFSITGTATGNCDGACIQTFMFSLPFEFLGGEGDTYGGVVDAVNSRVASSGPWVGSFGVAPLRGPSWIEFSAFNGPVGGGILFDLLTTDERGLMTTTPWIAPSFDRAQLYRCQPSTADFCLRTFGWDWEHPSPIPGSANVTVTRVAMAEESSSLISAGIGLAAILSGLVLQRGSRSSSR
jgi:hypothetical protein